MFCLRWPSSPSGRRYISWEKRCYLPYCLDYVDKCRVDLFAEKKLCLRNLANIKGIMKAPLEAFVKQHKYLSLAILFFAAATFVFIFAKLFAAFDATNKKSFLTAFPLTFGIMMLFLRKKRQQ